VLKRSIDIDRVQLTNAMLRGSNVGYFPKLNSLWARSKTVRLGMVTGEAETVNYLREVVKYA